MRTAHDLARYAALAADYICVDDVEAFQIENGLLDGEARVTFRFFSGKSRTYLVRLEKERDTPAGESLPGSP